MSKIDNVSGLILLVLIVSILFFTIAILRSIRRRTHRQRGPHSPLEQPTTSSVGTFEHPISYNANHFETGTVFVHTDLTVSLTAEQHQAWSALPPRPRQAATLIAFGKSTAQVATIMSIQQSTVRGYLKQVYAALHLRSRTELANFVRDIALLDPPPQDTAPPN